MIHVEPTIHEILRTAAKRVDRQVGPMLRRALDKIAKEYTEENGHKYLD